MSNCEKEQGIRHTHHVGGPAVLAGDEDTRRISDTVRDYNLLNFIAERILDSLAEVIELSGLSFTGRLLFFSLLELETFLGDADQLLVFEFLQLGDGVLVDGVDEEEDLEALLFENFEER